MESTSPAVSVIIPTYNRADYVGAAIDSVLNQTYTDFELIVIDDGSSDDTPSVLDRYGDRLRVIRQENSGCAAARNAGVAAARGEWLAFLDSDDEWESEKLEVQMRAVDAHPQIRMHVANLTFVMQDGKEFDFFRLRKFEGFKGDCTLFERPLEAFLRHEFVFLQASLIRREALLGAGGFNASIKAQDDTDLFYRLVLEGPWGVTPRSLATIYWRSEEADNISDAFGKEKVRRYGDLVSMLARVREDPRVSTAERALVGRKLSIYRFSLGLEQLRAGHGEEARRSLHAAFDDDPSLGSLAKWALLRMPFGVGIALWDLKESLGPKGFRRSEYARSTRSPRVD